MNYTPEQLQEMLDAATGGVWCSDGECGVCAASDQLNSGYFVAECSGPDKEVNATLIAASRKIAEDALELHGQLRWRSVEDELPEENGYVIARLHRNLPFITMFYNGSFGIDGISEVTSPTHWMPLPTPPKESNDE